MLRGESYLGAHRLAVPGARPLLLVGEDNPRTADPQYALYPYPVGCAGWRLAEKIMGWGTSAQLGCWRTNLCARAWSTQEACRRAGELLLAVRAPWAVAVLLGTKVAAAFRHHMPDLPSGPFDRHVVPGLEIPEEHEFTATSVPGLTLVLLPHPSGRCRAWNVPGSAARARALLASAGVRGIGAAHGNEE